MEDFESSIPYNSPPGASGPGCQLYLISANGSRVPASGCPTPEGLGPASRDSWPRFARLGVP